MDYSKLKKIASELGDSAGAKLKGTAKEAESVGGKALDLLSLPQKYASKKAAELAGLKPGSTSEENFANLVEKGASALGIPEDSTIGNAGKALAVAGAEVFADPLGFVPIGKIASGIKGISKMSNLKALGKIAEEAKHTGALEKIAPQMQEYAKKIKDSPIMHITDESSRATETAQKWQKLKNAEETAKIKQPARDTLSDWDKAAREQAANQTLNAPIKGPVGPVAMGNKIANDQALVKEAIRELTDKGLGNSPDFNALVKNYVRMRTK